MDDNQKFYSVYDYRNQIKPGDKMKLEISITPQQEVLEISQFVPKPLKQLQAMREESVAAEHVIYDNLRESARAWETQAANTMLLDMAIEYVKTPKVQHTFNKWEKDDYGHTISNMVYRMKYHIYTHTRYDKEMQQSVPCSFDVSWDLRTNSPDIRNNSTIAGQCRKRYADIEDAEKYINGRIKAYSHLFKEISPPIPQEHAKRFKVNGQLLPGYSIEGEEPKTELQNPMNGLESEVKATLQFFIDEDVKNNGTLKPGTLEMIATQGFEYRDGKLEKAQTVKNTFTIYQLKGDNEMRHLRYEPFDRLVQDPDIENYYLVYNAALKHGDTLDKIYMDFNSNKPKDFDGHSLSVSDVIVMSRDGKHTAYYVDSFGFKELPGFPAVHPDKSAAPDKTVQNHKLSKDKAVTITGKLSIKDRIAEGKAKSATQSSMCQKAGAKSRDAGLGD